MSITLIRRRCAAAGLFALVLVGCGLAVSEPTAGPAQVAAPSSTEPVVPMPNDPDSLKFAVLGDFGNGEPGQMLLAQQMVKTRAAFPYELVLLVGSYAQRHYLGDRRAPTMTETVQAWRDHAPRFIPLPHPSWRNTAWLRRNPWFEAELLPVLRDRVQGLL